MPGTDVTTTKIALMGPMNLIAVQVLSVYHTSLALFLHSIHTSSFDGGGKREESTDR